jgi:hypothetical protein
MNREKMSLEDIFVRLTADGGVGSSPEGEHEN